MNDSIDQLCCAPCTNHILIELTSRCNIACVYCARCQENHGKGSDIDPQVLERLVASLAKRGVTSVCANGFGETTIYADWHLFCNRLIDEGMKLGIISNFAKRFSDEEIEALTRFSTIEVSCDTADPVLFAALRRGAKLDTLIYNIQKVQYVAAHKSVPVPRFSLSCVVSDKSVPGLPELVRLGLRLGVSNFSFNNLTKYPDVQGAVAVNHVTQMPVRQMALAAKTLVETVKFLERRKIGVACQQGLIDSLLEKIRAVGNAENPHCAAPLSETCCKTYTVKQPARHTRNCLDPWKMAVVKASGGIATTSDRQPRNP